MNDLGHRVRLAPPDPTNALVPLHAPRRAAVHPSRILFLPRLASQTTRGAHEAAVDATIVVAGTRKNSVEAATKTLERGVRRGIECGAVSRPLHQRQVEDAIHLRNSPFPVSTSELLMRDVPQLSPPDNRSRIEGADHPVRFWFPAVSDRRTLSLLFATKSLESFDLTPQTREALPANIRRRRRGNGGGEQVSTRRSFGPAPLTRWTVFHPIGKAKTGRVRVRARDLFGGWLSRDRWRRRTKRVVDRGVPTPVAQRNRHKSDDRNSEASDPDAGAAIEPSLHASTSNAESELHGIHSGDREEVDMVQPPPADPPRLGEFRVLFSRSYRPFGPGVNVGAQRGAPPSEERSPTNENKASAHLPNGRGFFAAFSEGTVR